MTAAAARARGPAQLEKLNNALHRDIGYLVVGLTIVYGVSGIAVNHTADWNPSYQIATPTFQIGPVEAKERDEMVREAQTALGVTEPRNVFPVRPGHAPAVFRVGVVSWTCRPGRWWSRDPPAPGPLRVDRPHLERAEGGVDLDRGLAVALIFVAATGLFVLKGKSGITGRGAWLTAVGVVIPVACRFLLKAL